MFSLLHRKLLFIHGKLHHEISTKYDVNSQKKSFPLGLCCLHHLGICMFYFFPASQLQETVKCLTDSKQPKGVWLDAVDVKIYIYIYVPWSKVAILGMGDLQPLIGILISWVYKPLRT